MSLLQKLENKSSNNYFAEIRLFNEEEYPRGIIMVDIGRMNQLVVKDKQGEGIVLDGGELGDIIMRDRYSSVSCKKGDVVQAFVYIDKEQLVIATTRKPYILVGQYAKLTVVGTSGAGAFLGWGLDDDLFVPNGEQQNSMRKGRSYVVYAFLSPKSNRITASSKLYKFLDQQPPKFDIGEAVDLLIYSETDMGYSAVVNGSHTGMIYQNEVFKQIEIGEKLKGYVKKIREDNKIDLRLQPEGYQQIDDASQAILDIIKDAGGMVSVTDKSAPEDIYEMFGVSKKLFKKALGGLYKKRIVSIEANGIKLIE